MALYNILTCSGFTEEATSWVASSGCLKGRIGIVILFFLIAIIRRWGAEEFDIDFSFLFALVGGVLGYLILITFTGSFKIAFAVGLVAALVLGYGGGTIFGGGGEY